MKEPKISIIIPVYNVEKYLEECLNSIVNQPYKNLELICINDGSTDKSAAILQKYANQDDRFVIINQKNQGQSVARNKGLDVATGEWISFVDSDDWIEQTLYINFIKTLNESPEPFDLFMFDGENHYSDKPEGKHFINVGNWNNDEKSNLYTFNDCSSPFSCPTVIYNKIYKRELIENNHLRFPEGLIFEDTIFSIKSQFFAKKIYIDESSYYLYRYVATSTMGNLNKNVYDMFNILNLLEEFLKEQDIFERHKYALFQFMVKLLGYLFIKGQKFIDEEFYFTCRKYLLEKFSGLERKIYIQLNNINVFFDMMNYLPQQFYNKYAFPNKHEYQVPTIYKILN